MSGRPARDVDYEDVDDVIGVASELQAVDAERLSVEELTEVARDLDIPQQYVGPAVAELRRRRAAALAAAAARSRRRLLWTWGALGMVALLGVFSVVDCGAVSDAHHAVLQQRAQVVNVMDRQRATRATFDVASGEQAAAELAGAENRVRIARRDYDAAATAYNRRVDGFLGALWASLRGWPDRAPLSSEGGGW
ncbi:MAG: hypothetical protein CVU56_11155 [Deltaproteobacteria bacterium HGW-Deltaproteobacteria-14]|jgi:hypothetical protein|nr:MAG: hypothetical protein CVU56_11155 [Deltaproteobacteria bacterium HGW-Deltaproteobacteria-14]